jgi:hypothetical protein
MTNLPLLKGISSSRFGRFCEEVWKLYLQVFLSFPSSFFCVVAPLNLAHFDGLVPRDSFRHFQDLYGILLICEILSRD